MGGRVDTNVSVNKSQFAENTSGNRNFSTETRGELKSDPLTYKPTTNEERLKRTNDILSTKSSGEIDNHLSENFFNTKPKKRKWRCYRDKGETSQRLDELVNNLHNVRVEPNNSDKLNKQGVESVTKGEIEVDVNGKKLYPIVVLRNYKDGTSVVHEVADIKRTAIGSNEPVQWDNFRKNSGSQSPNNSSITQNSENVPAQEKSRLSGESSVSDTTDSLRALPRSGEIGNNHILTQDSENVNGRSYEKETESLPEDFDVKHYVTDQVKAQNQSGPTGESSAINATDSLRALSRPAGDTIQSVSQTTENVNGRSYEKETESLPEDFDVKHYVTDQVKAQNQSLFTLSTRI